MAAADLVVVYSQSIFTAAHDTVCLYTQAAVHGTALDLLGYHIPQGAQAWVKEEDEGRAMVQALTWGTSKPQRSSRSRALRIRSKKEPSGVWWILRLPGWRLRLAELVTLLRWLYTTNLPFQQDIHALCSSHYPRARGKAKGATVCVAGARQGQESGPRSATAGKHVKQTPALLLGATSVLALARFSPEELTIAWCIGKVLPGLNIPDQAF
ncbi:MAG: hypothetical protein FRX49_09687 [Trebouxia sp. A1-2]|nr:MAG: hypothetical protein FRX49_09687 [Trebouxia sp. A1-2]